MKDILDEEGVVPGEKPPPIPAEPEGAGGGLVASPQAAKAAGDVAEATKAIAKEARALKGITDFIRALKVYVANRGSSTRS